MLSGRDELDPSVLHKGVFGVEGKTVLLSFGPLSLNKGIENVISALPAILSGHQCLEGIHRRVRS